jgi:tetratricopeptide (TPR) repeat protein
MRQDPPNDCVGCHMPRKATAGIPHSNDTNHRIVRRAGQPYPDYAFDEPSPDIPGLVCINRRGEDAARPMPAMTKLLAYAEISQKVPSLSHYYYDLLEQLKQSAPDDPTVLCALGRKALAENDDTKATAYLTRALQNGGDYANTYVDLGEALARAGRVEESVQILEKGAVIWPFSRDIQKSLVFRYLTLKKLPQAHETLKQYVALFPDDTFMQEALAKLEGRHP